ncbi:MAG TPA: ATP-binding protein [Polyangiaceae bacterium]|nr:ATP-binding protein [Polyangiaceae bacterium]
MRSTKNRQRIGYRRIVQLLVYLGIIPSVLLLSLGIILMIIGHPGFDLLMGILTVSFVGAVVTGVVLVLVFVRREANLSELQADFVSKVSHELRTPLTAIRLFAETLERSKDDPKTAEACVRMLAQETDRLSHRIERLLDWGRMEAGRKLFDLQATTARAIVDGAIDAFSPLRTNDKIVFEAQVDDRLPEVMVDRDAMIDVLVNLLSNALKYGGSPPIISLRAYRDPSGKVALEVQDNGAGIPAPEHRRIFEKFYRIDDRLSRTREGSGLGLAIVKHIVRAHRGRVVVVSSKGVGSTFRILLDAASAKEASQSDTQAEQVALKTKADAAPSEAS